MHPCNTGCGRPALYKCKTDLKYYCEQHHIARCCLALTDVPATPAVPPVPEGPKWIECTSINNDILTQLMTEDKVVGAMRATEDGRQAIFIHPDHIAKVCEKFHLAIVSKPNRLYASPGNIASLTYSEDPHRKGQWQNPYPYIPYWLGLNIPGLNIVIYSGKYETYPLLKKKALVKNTVYVHLASVPDDLATIPGNNAKGVQILGMNYGVDICIDEPPDAENKYFCHRCDDGSLYAIIAPQQIYLLMNIDRNWNSERTSRFVQTIMPILIKDAMEHLGDFKGKSKEELFAEAEKLYLKTFEESREARKRVLTEQLIDRQTKHSTALKDLLRFEKELLSLKDSMHVLELKDDVSMALKSWRNVLNIPEVNSVRVFTSQIVVNTGMIKCIDVPLGPWRIVINTSTDTISLSTPNPITKDTGDIAHHPHVFGLNHTCWGTGAAALSSLLAARDYGSVILFIVEFLKTFNNLGDGGQYNRTYEALKARWQHDVQVKKAAAEKVREKRSAAKKEKQEKSKEGAADPTQPAPVEEKPPEKDKPVVFVAPPDPMNNNIPVTDTTIPF